MTHSRSWDMEIGRPSVENVTLGLRPRVTFSTSGSSYFHAPLITVSHLLNVTLADPHFIDSSLSTGHLAWTGFYTWQRHTSDFDIVQNAAQLTSTDTELTATDYLYTRSATRSSLRIIDLTS